MGVAGGSGQLTESGCTAMLTLNPCALTSWESALFTRLVYCAPCPRCASMSEQHSAPEPGLCQLCQSKLHLFQLLQLLGWPHCGQLSTSSQKYLNSRKPPNGIRSATVPCQSSLCRAQLLLQQG